MRTGRGRRRPAASIDGHALMTVLRIRAALARSAPASGVLNAVQQLASAIGVALLGTVFFNALAVGDFHHALGRTLWLDVGLTCSQSSETAARPTRRRRAVRRGRVANEWGAARSVMVT